MAVSTSDEWLRIADEFNDTCKMPNCIGSIDGKHCRIRCPPNAGSLYFNYKRFHSVNLLGVADTNYCFTLIDVEAHGREKDSSVFSNSSFAKAFISGYLNLPPMRNIPGTKIIIPLYLVGDEAFPLKPNLMRPFPRRELDFGKTIFKGVLSNTMRTIECAFGLLTKKFGIFQRAFETNVEVTDCTIKSAGVVYNYIRKTQATEVKRREEEILEQKQQNITVSVEHSACFRRPSTEALQVRDKLKDYLVSLLGRLKAPITLRVQPWPVGKGVFTLHLFNPLFKFKTLTV